MRLNRHALDAWRQERGFTIQQLADAVGKDRTLVSRILTGERRATPNFIADCARVLKVPKVVLLADPNVDAEPAA